MSLKINPNASGGALLALIAVAYWLSKRASAAAGSVRNDAAGPRLAAMPDTGGAPAVSGAAPNMPGW